MTFDGIAAIQSRIDAIQQQFSAAASGLAGAPLGAAASSSAGASPDFASLLAQASAGSTLSPLGTGDTSATAAAGGSDLTSLLGALGGASGTGTDTSAVEAQIRSILNGLSGTGSGSDTLTGLGGLTGATGTNGFVSTALVEAGKPYRFGAQASASDPSPRAFDCSELVQWAAARNGVKLPDGSWNQYLAAKQAGDVVPVDVALRTPGALLFSFSTEPVPGGGRPSHAHVAISLGDGRTIEARGRAYGVGSFSAANRFTYGAIVPGLTR